MSTIQFKEVNCKNCYKCLRSCSVNAISFKDDHAQIIEDECILCGKCLKVCPQNAKSVKNDLDKVKGFINRNLKVYASIAPSFAAAFSIKNEGQLWEVFNKLGFTYFEETAVGASIVTSEYQKLIEAGNMTNIITSACPTIISLIEKHYPQLINQLAPVVTPMIAHTKMLKETYGARIKTIFIGPCLSKKGECEDSDNSEAIDAVITFEEFEEWMKEEGLSFQNLKDSEIQFNVNKTRFNNNARFYPTPGGIIKSLGTAKRHNYKLIKFDGIDRCKEVLEQIQVGDIKGYFIEMNSCVGGCLGGVCMNSNGTNFLKMRERLIDYVNVCSASKVNSDISYETKVNLSKKFKDRSKRYINPEEKCISEILTKIGKYSKEQELNCGACGYSTCREKAAAVYRGKADLKMCLPYMREMAESISNVIINSTPNAIIALTEDFNIQQANFSACKIFGLKPGDYQYKNIFEVLDCSDIMLVSQNKKNIYNQKYFYEKYDIIVEQSILYIAESHMTIIVMKDITKSEKHLQQLHEVRSEMVDIAQKVINKQMRVAQEIASLLGETTAETKIALTKLKNSIQSELGDDI